MTFRNQTILIACSEKKDRLQFFNYFDDLHAEKIFTAKDITQMQQMLADGDDEFTVLAFEISAGWFQNNSQIIDIKVSHPQITLVGLVSSHVNLNQKQYQEIKSHVSELLFSPITQQELIAKGVADNNKAAPQTVAASNELDTFLHAYFNASSLPQLLIDVTDQKIKHSNDAIKHVFGVKNDLTNTTWFDLIRKKSPQEIEQIKSLLNEKGHVVNKLFVDLGVGPTAVKLHLNSITVDDQSFYLAEIYDHTEQLFQQRFLWYLDLVTTMDFDNKDLIGNMQSMLEWAQLDFCFIVKKNRAGEYKQIIWDCSLNNYAQQFIAGNHDFIFRKLAAEDEFEIKHEAYTQIPGDEFLNFYSVNSFLAFNCYIDSEYDAIMVCGGLKSHRKWSSLKLLFNQLSLHYKQSMAFKVLQKSHESESQYDVLTNLLNRRYIVKAIEQSIEKSNQFMAVMFLDLDRFKVINDSLGHDVGDDVLINIAKILKKHVGEYGVAARYAGDEFLILLNKKVNEKVTTTIANNILKSVANPIKLRDGSEINLTISLGIAYHPEHGQAVNKLIKNADIALYDAKLNGKNRYTIYQSQLDGDHTKQNEEMVRNLQIAIEKDQIDVYFQPKINAATEDIMGFEALVRWEHPELGIISPGLFIPLAEQTDLIHQIGLLVIRKACVRLKRWQKRFNIPLTMSVNLSPIQLSDKDLIGKINSIIDDTGIYPKHLDFEITESEKFKSVKDALLMFKKIVNLGCTLSIDDFGTGHSTLEYLRKIPAKTLKIDQVFVKNIGLSPDDEAILDATIDMAKRVGHFIVAEGVETEEQRQYLSNKGCDYFQGYLYCRPVPAAQIERILAQREKILKNN